MRKTTRLRELFCRPEILVLPGTCNALQARMVQAAGFEACYMSGGGTSNSLLGVADAGFTTLTEMTLNAGYIASAIDLPLLSDADTGYGNALSVRHAIHRFIQAGVAGVHLEDQVFPKRCGYVAGKEVIPLEEAVGKYRAAMDAKQELDADFVVIARTDARTAVGGSLAEAIRRARAYRAEAQVDAVYFEGAPSMAELGEFVAAIRDLDATVPIMAGTSAITPSPTWAELEAAGLAVAFYPGAAFNAANIAAWDFLHDFKARGVQALDEFQARTRGHPLANFGVNDLVGFPALRALEERYLPGDVAAKYAQSAGVYTP